MADASSESTTITSQERNADIGGVPVVAVENAGRDQEEAELEVVGDAVHAPGLRLRLEGADQQLASVFLEVGVTVVVAQHRQRGNHLNRSIRNFSPAEMQHFQLLQLRDALRLGMPVEQQ